jgi:hypothetical protein
VTRLLHPSPLFKPPPHPPPHSRSVKELREAISGAQLDAGDLEQQAQHLRRQLATLNDRIKRLESQVCVWGGGVRAGCVVLRVCALRLQRAGSASVVVARAGRQGMRWMPTHTRAW